MGGATVTTYHSLRNPGMIGGLDYFTTPAQDLVEPVSFQSFISVSNPSRIVTTTRDNNYLFHFDDNITVHDITNLEAPSEVVGAGRDSDTYPSLYGAYDGLIVDQTLYVAADDNLSCWSVIDPTDPVLLGSLNDARLRSGRIRFANSRLYILDYHHLSVVDVNDPYFPTYITEPNLGWATTFQPNGIDVSNDGTMLAVCGYSNGPLQLWDITSPTPVQIGVDISNNYLDRVRGAAFSPTDSYLYVVTGFYRLLTYDISNPSSPVLVDNIYDTALLGNIQDCVAGDTRLYALSNQRSSFVVYDIDTNPAAPAYDYTRQTTASSYWYPNQIFLRNDLLLMSGDDLKDGTRIDIFQ